MYHCTYCSFSSASLRGYVLHFSIHKNLFNVKFPCAMAECNRYFRNYNSFKCHVLRNHSCPEKEQNLVGLKNSDKLNWSCMYCKETCSSVSWVITHLKLHIDANLAIECPFHDCNFSFKNRSSFSCHLHRKHKNPSKLEPEQKNDLFFA